MGVFYLRKKQPFGFYKKKAKSQTEKTPNCHKTKTRMKEKKKSSKHCLTPHTLHTRLKLHNIHTLIHQNFIHVIKSINQQNSQFSISTLLSSLYPNIRLQCLIYLPIKMNPD